MRDEIMGQSGECFVAEALKACECGGDGGAASPGN